MSGKLHPLGPCAKLTNRYFASKAVERTVGGDGDVKMDFKPDVKSDAKSETKQEPMVLS